MVTSRWYVLNVYAGYEKKVVSAILEQAEKKGLSHFFEELLVPSENITEIRRGQKIDVEKQYFPGYILVKMIMNDDAWHLVCNMPRVTNFLGAKGKPSPISQTEINRILSQDKAAIKKAARDLNYEVGETVRINDGPFATFQGVVEEVDAERNRLKVSVTIFGRPTPVELEFSQVERV